MKKKIINIAIIVGILGLVAGVYFYKNPIGENEIDVPHDVREMDFSMDINGEDFDIERLTSYGVPVMIDFTASWCVPCKQFNPILEELKEEYGDEIIIKKIDVEEYPEIAEEYGIYTMPTQLLYKSDGSVYLPQDILAANTDTIYDIDETTPLYTKHIGSMSKGKLILMFNDMGANLETTEKEN